MEIITVDFEEPVILSINHQKIKLVAFKTQEQAHIKFGVEAPRQIKVHREEVYRAIKEQEKESTTN